MDETLQAELILTLRQSQTSQNADTSKHCQYHRNYGHTTKGCQALKDKVEELIQADHFQRFIKTNDVVNRSPHRDRHSSRRQKEYTQRYPSDRPARGDVPRRDDHQQATRRNRSESPERSSHTRRRVQEVINAIVGPISFGIPNEEINSIEGGFAEGGCYNSARKKHLRVI